MENKNFTANKFTESLNPFGFDKNNKKRVYVQIYENEELNDAKKSDLNHDEQKEYTLVLGLLTIEMMNRDIELYQAVITQDKQLNEYHPYLYGFTKNITKKEMDIIKKLFKDKIQTLNNQSIDIIPAFLSFSTKKDDTLETEKISITGTIFFSASPFRFKKGTLTFSDTALNKDETNLLEEWAKKRKESFEKLKYHIKENLNNENHKLLLKAFPEKMPSQCCLKIYNVGQANCTYLISPKYRMLIDIGIDKNWLLRKGQSQTKTPQYYLNYSSLQHLKPHSVILTHWDFDHIAGVTLLPEKEFSKLWIAPDITELPSIPLGALRLACYLQIHGKLCMVKSSFNKKLFWNNEFISIYKGNPNVPGKQKANEISNNHGLIIKFDFEKATILFPGDCEYEAWPDDIRIEKNEYNILMIPHHGARMKFSNAPLNPQNNKKFAICSYGENNHYGHPDPNHINALNNNYHYCVLKTMGHKNIFIFPKAAYDRIIKQHSICVFDFVTTTKLVYYECLAICIRDFKKEQ